MPSRAEIIPFPLVRRTDFIRRHLQIISNLPPESGRRHIIQQLRVQREALLRRGVDQYVIDHEIIALEAVLVSAVMERVA